MSPVADPEICDDGIDNDGDGLIDGDDPDCSDSIAVTIDVIPGRQKKVSLSNAIVPVAIITTGTFDATQVDPSSVCFGDAEEPSQRDCTPKRNHGQATDVDRDGDLDLVLRFEIAQTGIDLADTQACLTGNLTGGQTIAGCGSIIVVQ